MTRAHHGAAAGRRRVTGLVAALTVCLLPACDGGSADAPLAGLVVAQAAAPAAVKPARPAVLPVAPGARYVKLVAVSEWSGKPFTAVAEFNLIDATGATLDRAGWKVLADSADAADPAANAIDGNPKTHWHSRWQGTPAPLPHELTIDLGTVARLSGFRYLPRQDNTSNGTIGQYRLHLSADGAQWGEPVNTGSFVGMGAAADEKTVVFAAQTANHAPVVKPPAAQSSALGVALALQLAASDADGDPLTYTATGLPAGLMLAPATGSVTGTPIAVGSQRVQVTVSDNKGLSTKVAFAWAVLAPAPLAGSAPPAAAEVRFVKLEQVSEINGKPWASIAEFNVLDAKGAVLPRTGWLASADSADVSDRPDNAIDGNAASIWHSQWSGAAPPPPHSFIVDMRRYARVGGFRVLPRQDKQSNGVIARYRFFLSVDGVNWGKPVAEGDFSTMGAINAEKTVLVR